MARKSVTRADLIKAVYQQAAVTKEYAADLVDQIIKEICTTLEQGESVKLSSFGGFTVRQKSKRPGRNPRTGIEVPIPPRHAITFSASPVLKAHINRGHSPLFGFDPQDVRLPGKQTA
jgi:integration host factor subunit alpha